MYFLDRGCVRTLHHLYGYATETPVGECIPPPPVISVNVRRTMKRETQRHKRDTGHAVRSESLITARGNGREQFSNVTDAEKAAPSE